MKEQNLYVDGQQLKSVNRYLLVALIGFCYYATVNVWYYFIPREYELSRFAYALFYITPAIYVALPVELLIFCVMLRHWKSWSGTHHRAIIATLSGGVILIWLTQQIFNF